MNNLDKIRRRLVGTLFVFRTKITSLLSFGTNYLIRKIFMDLGLKIFQLSGAKPPKIGEEPKELTELATEGIKHDALCSFMNYLLEEGSNKKPNELVDGMFRVWTNRGEGNFMKLRITAYPMNICPLRKCGIEIKPLEEMRDVFFHPSEYPYAEGKNELEHHSLRLNDLSLHLAQEHSIFQKGESPWDQCYPASPLSFAKDFYIPWLNKH